MAFKWTEGDHVTSNIVDATEQNASFNNLKGEMNGGLDRENLPNGAFTSATFHQKAFQKYALVPNVRLQNSQILTAHWESEPAGPNETQAIRAISHNTYGGGWRTNGAHFIETEFEEGMLHLEFNCWYWVYNSTADGDFLKTAQFQILLDGSSVVRSGALFQNVGQAHLVADIPISKGSHKIELQWRTSAFYDVSVGSANPVVIGDPVFYYDGGQLLALNRYR